RRFLAKRHDATGRHALRPTSVVLTRKLHKPGKNMERWYPLIRQVLTATWRWRWLLVLSAWGTSLIGWAAGSTVPDAYESQARLYVDADAVLTPLLRGIAIDTQTANQLEIMQKTLLSRPNLNKLISITDLNLSVSSPQQRDGLVQGLGREVKVTAEGRNL